MRLRSRASAPKALAVLALFLSPESRPADHPPPLEAALADTPEAITAECPPGQPNIDCALGSGTRTPSQHLAQLKCREIFAATPPAWLGTIMDPPSQKFFAKHWLPVCGYYRFEFFRESLNQPRIQDLSTFDWTPTDVCSLPSHTTPELGTEQNPGTSRPEIRNMTFNERKSYLDDYTEIRSTVEEACCRDFVYAKACREAFQAIPALLCQSPLDATQPDPCLASIAYYHSNIKQTGETPYPLGEVHLPAVLDGFGQRIGHAAMVAHELGHACIDVQAHLLWKAGVAPRYAALRSTGCELTPAIKSLYENFFVKAGASAETYRCLERLAHDATQALFTDTACPKGCARSYLAESWADWISFQVSPPAEYLSYICLNRRDDRHALPADELACYLRTPSARALLEKRLSCR
jgi:hypothetical protein